MQKKKKIHSNKLFFFQKFEEKKMMAFLTFDNMICSGNASKAGRGMAASTKTSM